MTKHRDKSQAAAILRHLQRGRMLIPLEALHRYGCLRLGARVWELKQDGHNITPEMVTLRNGKRVARYSLA